MPGLLAALRYAGRRVRCPACGGRFRRFADFRGRAGAQCPRCGALERHRALALLLFDQRPSLLTGAVLHLAPEAAIERRLRAVDGIEYATADLERTDVDIRLDVTHMPLRDASWDLVLCSHVLEHVADDAAAIAELARVLRPGGTLLVMVPEVPGIDETVEDPSAVTPEQRLERYGQADHVRIYAPEDLTRRLEAGGLAVEVVVPNDPDGCAGLMPGERMWLARRPA